MTSELVEISKKIPTAIIDLRYASSNNIAGKPLYKFHSALLCHQVLEALLKVSASLETEGYRIVVWDAYRSLSAQKELRKICKDTKYVAVVSNHCRGVALDVTLATIGGDYLDMGTDFDKFAEDARADSTNLTQVQQDNRSVLKTHMEKQGFKQLLTEWWHFDFESLVKSPIIEES